MHLLDLGIFLAYMVTMLGVGYYFMKKNTSQEDYYVGGRSIGSWHIGLSVVATDVGGGFSIGLGGLGFAMGLSGSWMLFTGLIGAWMAAVILIPRVKSDPAFSRFFTFPQIIGQIFDSSAANVAAVICFLGYLGFTSSQLLAGAKLASGTFEGIDLQTALLIMGVVAVVYTVMGGLKAVIYTDTIQWIILMLGLMFIGIPLAYSFVGGWEGIIQTLPPEFFSFTNLNWQDFVNWGITIIPIWFVGMTLYQRIFAAKDVRSAKRAWFIAGLFEWPIMAFLGVSLGLLSRVAVEQGALEGFSSQMDPEMGLPVLLSQILPAGILGLMMSAYFSAVLSTADSCLMAASGNLSTDLLGKFLKNKSHEAEIQISQILTLAIGAVAVFLAWQMTEVLSLMLYSYAFMVSGLLVPVVAGLFFNYRNPKAAVSSMISGGLVTAGLTLLGIGLPFGFDPNFFGILTSVLAFLAVNNISGKMKTTKDMIIIETLSATENATFLLKNEIADFLVEHLEKFGDPREDILKCLDYALDSGLQAGGFVVLARENGKILGALVMNKTGMSGYIPENILVYIAVDATQRGKGIGGKILETALKMANGAIALHVEPDNPARKLYERMGFTNKYLEMRLTRN